MSLDQPLDFLVSAEPATPKPPRDPGFLHAGCTCYFPANLCPFVGQYGWQVPADAFHPTGLRQEAAGPGGTSPGGGSAGASRWLSPSDGCSKADVPTKPKKKTQKTPEDLPTCKGSGGSLQKETLLLHCLAVLRGLLPWHPPGRASDRGKARRSVPARTACSEHQRKKLSASLCSC